MDKPLKSVTHDQCDARPTLTFPAAGHHRPLTATKLYCLVTEAHVCEQLTQGCYQKARGRESNPRPSESLVHRSNHYTTMPQTALGRDFSPVRKHSHTFHIDPHLLLYSGIPHTSFLFFASPPIPVDVCSISVPYSRSLLTTCTVGQCHSVTTSSSFLATRPKHRSTVSAINYHN